MKDLEALGWHYSEVEGRNIYTRDIYNGLHVTTVQIVSGFSEITGEHLTVLHISDEEGDVSIPMPTDTEALNAANALACVTPDNPKGRWVE